MRLNIDHADYVETALQSKFSLALTGKVDVQQYEFRVLAMGRVYRVLGLNDILAKASWSVDSFRQVDNADEELQQVQTQAGAALQGNIFIFELYRHGTSTLDSTNSRKRRVQILETATFFVDSLQIYQWTRLDLTTESISKDWLPSEYDGMKQFGSVKSADVTWRLAQKTTGAGFFIVGDAAAVVDPASAHGVLKALMSGIMAAHLIGRSIESVTPRSAQVTQIETHCMETYQQWLKDWFWHDVTNLNNLYAQFPQIFMDSILID